MKNPMKRLAICWIICIVPLLLGQAYPPAFLLLPALSIALIAFSANMIFDNSYMKKSGPGTTLSFLSLFASVSLFSIILTSMNIFEDYDTPLYVWFVFVVPFILLILLAVLKIEAQARVAKRIRNFRRNIK
ncbi:hypothetical protein PAESOLCIP111_02443 [Paenibacillus solanacearum]|uniref:Uncharacterized protein n=1 Tax=Paenibacillus solanacearum TaxID=2048548 RepID=A0A916K0Q4_9BACL|nr:hypothetical protein [Paenibacillus solanacearum]CAG7622777.1 hypothetical protein PAESOLCIP111_02443 [Paenibacillus solanacearum]